MRTTRSWPIGLALLAAPAAQSIPVLPPGYQARMLYDEPDPPSFRGFAASPSGLLYVGFGNEILEVDASGSRTPLHRFPAGSGADLIRLLGSELYFADSQTTRLWRRDLVTGAEVAGSTPLQTFDLVRAPSGELLASANPLWPSGDGGIWRVDFGGGSHREVIALQGPSGPLAFDARGDLYYATQSPIYPTPPGSQQVLRFDAARLAAALQGGPPLTAADGTVVLSGLDGAFALVLDDRGRLYWSDPQNGGVARTAPAAGPPDPLPLVARPVAPDTTVALQLQYLEGGPATFDPFQPDQGGSIYASFTDWGASATVWEIRTQRPAVVSSPAVTAPPGRVTFLLSGLPPSGVAWLCASGWPAVPEQILFNWNGSPFWSGLDLRFPPVCVGTAVSAAGDASLSLVHPGGASATLSFQGIGFDPSSWPFGTSSIYSLTLLP